MSQAIPKSPMKCAGKPEDKIIFSCVGNAVGNSDYHRHILLVFQD